MGILFLWVFATSRYKVSFSLKSTSKHIHKSISYWQGRESRGSRSHVVIARDPGCLLSQACCPWSLDNTVTLHPLATVSITIKTSEREGMAFRILLHSINKQTPTRRDWGKGRLASLWDSKPRKGNKRNQSFICSLWLQNTYVFSGMFSHWLRWNPSVSLSSLGRQTKRHKRVLILRGWASWTQAF